MLHQQHRRPQPSGPRDELEYLASSGSCWALLNHCSVPGPVPGSAANRDYQPGFATELMLKDLRLSQQAALAVGAATPLGAEATALYGLLKAAGRGASDYSAIITCCRARVLHRK
ncbi:MAG: NAD-binding protein [Janthinobacterium lividum]